MTNSNDETQFGGGDATHVGGTPPTTPDDGDDKRKLWLIALGVLLLGLLIGVGIAVAGGGDDKQAGDGTSTSTSSTSTSTTTLATTTTTTSGTTTTTVSNTPKINSFSANPQSASCLAGSTVNVTLSWSTSNTTENVLSVDSPGEYGTYPGTSGTQTLNHGCPASEMVSPEVHNYTLTAKGPNGQTQKTLTFSVNLIPV